MCLFHVYNKFDSMDCVVVTANCESEALRLAFLDGYLTQHLAVKYQDLTVLPIEQGYYIKSNERHVKRVE